ncbi:YciI family protein [Azospirillum brasilense]|uniref:YCII-related domain-containing protein n=1 Tax=Azospirillum brasilense TaxID=192 RepID=A0A6L3AYD0_AZOBR|nr:YciI family protein [Azospirillum brasilense]KAA0684730.1 hypothetical protein DS837_17010 [Azospirillum brasilense]
MARWIALFTDTPEMLEVRQQHGAAHLAYLDANRDKILIGGGLRPESGAPFVGGLWVLDVESRDEAVKLVEGDPYYRPEFRRYELLVWGKAIDRPVTL